MGWFALVPMSVAAMNLAMRARGDPLATDADTLVVIIAAVLFSIAAVMLYRPLFTSRRRLPPS